MQLRKFSRKNLPDIKNMLNFAIAFEHNVLILAHSSIG